ncbi:hypothetical protein SLEP1_g51097 [Rubroshorea leprosula]|uniref:Uncharacterized protein n=1 Tax=Rubroshorea leprosula TaxID=152421 RepID=A0AAV5M228_9ROSI|nr:hypothetical protein SLEP1_g51097 [Rubroshorea leprosula]
MNGPHFQKIAQEMIGKDGGEMEIRGAGKKLGRRRRRLSFFVLAAEPPLLF